MNNDNFTGGQRVFCEKWTRSNKVCLMFMKYTIGKTIRQIIGDSLIVKAFMESITKKFVKFNKVKK